MDEKQSCGIRNMSEDKVAEIAAEWAAGEWFFGMWPGPAKLLFRCFLFLFAAGSAGLAGDHGSYVTIPEAWDQLGGIQQRFSEYQVILEPDRNESEWWAGAPSVVRDDNGDFWLACRMRTADAPRGLRGYEIRILKSIDGVQFRKVHTIPREKVPIPGFERPSLIIDPETRQVQAVLAADPGTMDRGA